jgi:hypothetical protein
MRAELDGLRRAQRLRAIIEQAKGVLVAREGLTPDAAFLRLRELSQQHNVKLVEVAATVVGVAVPPDVTLDLDEDTARAVQAHLPASPGSSPAWRALREQPSVRRRTVSALLDAVTGTADTGNEAAGLMRDLLATAAVDAVALFRAAPDGALRLVGQSGYAADAVSAWRSVPPTPDLALSRSWQDDRALDLDDAPGLAAGFGAVLAVPVGSRDLGGVVVTAWQRADVDRFSLVPAVRRLGPLVLRRIVASDPELDLLEALLKVQFDPWLVLDPVPGADGTVRDLLVAATSPGRAEDTWLGRRLLSLWPSLAASPAHRELLHLTATGGAWVSDAVPGPGPWGSDEAAVRASRLGARIVVSWRRGGQPPSGA